MPKRKQDYSGGLRPKFPKKIKTGPLRPNWRKMVEKGFLGAKTPWEVRFLVQGTSLDYRAPAILQ